MRVDTISAIILGDLDTIKNNIDEGENPVSVINLAAQYDRSNIVRYCTDKVDDEIIYKAINRAAGNGSINSLKILMGLPNFSIELMGDEPMQIAAKYGRSEIIMYLLNDWNLNPNSSQYCILNTAVEENQMNIVKILLNDPRTVIVKKHFSSAATKMAYDCMKLLIEQYPTRSNRQFNLAYGENWLLRIAIRGRRSDIIDILIKDPYVLEEFNQRTKNEAYKYILARNRW
jgi:hypothetical protein